MADSESVAETMEAEITRLLAEIRGGNTEAQSRLASLVYDELHRLAAGYMYRERPDRSLQATILVHEAFIRLVGREGRSWQNRSHWFAAAARIMRRILIDYARARRSAKRGGAQPKVQIENAIVVSDDNCEEVIAVDQALIRRPNAIPARSNRGIEILCRIDRGRDRRSARDFAANSQGRLEGRQGVAA